MKGKLAEDQGSVLTVKVIRPDPLRRKAINAGQQGQELTLLFICQSSPIGQATQYHIYAYILVHVSFQYTIQLNSHGLSDYNPFC